MTIKEYEDLRDELAEALTAEELAALEAEALGDGDGDDEDEDLDALATLLDGLDEDDIDDIELMLLEDDE